MSYSVDNGQVVLRMSRDDYERILILLGAASSLCFSRGDLLAPLSIRIKDVLALLNRLNEGNPNHTPYEVPK